AEADAIHQRLAGSRLARTAAALSEAVEHTWSGSRARGLIEPLADMLRMLTGIQRIRLAGIWLAAAAAADAALTPFDPRPASVSRWTLWALCLVLGSAAAVWAKPVHAAWIDWRRTR